MPASATCRMFRRLLLLLLVTCALTATGCRKPEQIEERTEPIPLHETPYVETISDVKMAIVVGIAPLGRQSAAWCFFKMTGPVEAIARERARFDEFIGSLVYEPDEDIPFTWKVPNGWRELPGSGLRMATLRTAPLQAGVLRDLVDDPAIRVALRAFQTGYDARFAEVSISKAGGSMLANVNRWRHNDLGLPPIAAFDLPRLLRYRNLDTATIIMVEMAGPGGEKKAMPAFHPPIEQ